MKYYYTDPLAAAYMAREFGVTIYNPSLNSTIGLHKLVRDVYPQGIGGKKYNIHSKSIDIFKPMVGDLIKAVYKLDCGNGDFTYEDLVEIVPFGERFQYLDNIEIIQRNNKQFFMPEVENDL